jgi:hypothetical protein
MPWAVWKICNKKGQFDGCLEVKKMYRHDDGRDYVTFFGSRKKLLKPNADIFCILSCSCYDFILYLICPASKQFFTSPFGLKLALEDKDVKKKKKTKLLGILLLYSL